MNNLSENVHRDAWALRVTTSKTVFGECLNLWPPTDATLALMLVNDGTGYRVPPDHAHVRLPHQFYATDTEKALEVALARDSGWGGQVSIAYLRNSEIFDLYAPRKVA